MMTNRVKLRLGLGVFALLSLPCLLFGPRIVLARGGEGIGITAEADSVASTAPDTTAGGWGDPDFIRFVADAPRIRKDINFLVSESFSGALRSPIARKTVSFRRWMTASTTSMDSKFMTSGLRSTTSPVLIPRTGTTRETTTSFSGLARRTRLTRTTTGSRSGTILITSLPCLMWMPTITVLRRMVGTLLRSTMRTRTLRMRSKTLP